MKDWSLATLVYYKEQQYFSHIQSNIPFLFFIPSIYNIPMVEQQALTMSLIIRRL